eukprot:16768-Prymnesium_polylepis.1
MKAYGPQLYVVPQAPYASAAGTHLLYAESTRALLEPQSCLLFASMARILQARHLLRLAQTKPRWAPVRGWGRAGENG